MSWSFITCIHFYVLHFKHNAWNLMSMKDCKSEWMKHNSLILSSALCPQTQLAALSNSCPSDSIQSMYVYRIFLNSRTFFLSSFHLITSSYFWQNPISQVASATKGLHRNKVKERAAYFIILLLLIAHNFLL